MENLDFLSVFPEGNASLSVVASDGIMTTIHNLSPELIGRQCPLLQLSFEQGASGIPRSSIEASSVELVVHFLRFLYTGDYVSYDTLGALPFSLLMHAQLCRMAEIFEIPELQTLAHINVIRETELACSLPSPPLDLCQAIRFIYEHLTDQMPLVETILHYCVSCFMQHGLGTNDSFRQIAFELPSFHQDLCRTSCKRGFQDEGAIDIVRLPVQELALHSMQDIGKAATGDRLQGLCPGDISDMPKESGGKANDSLVPEAEYNLVHRPKLMNADLFENPEDEVHGFTLVHLPKSDAKNDSFTFEFDSEASEPRSSLGGLVDVVKGQQERLEDWTITALATDDISGSDSEWALV